MRSQMVTETRTVPTTTYQQQTRTRMKNVSRQVARVETKQQTYTVNVPQSQTRQESYNVQVRCALHRTSALHGSSSCDDTSGPVVPSVGSLHRNDRAIVSSFSA